MKASDFVQRERPKRRYSAEESFQNAWDQLVVQGRYRKWTFKQAEAAFNRQNDVKLPHTLKGMPKHKLDWFRRIGDVPPEELM